jgi:uncharacterized protein (TIGR00297 family)
MVHLGAGGFAFLLKYLTFPQASLCAAGAIAFNALVLPHLARGRLFHDGERATPWHSGILLYPVSVLLLILLFAGDGDGMEVAATGWVIMAAGDAAAAAWGRRFGRRPVPWNGGKTLAGSLACAVAAMAAAWVMLVWMGHQPVGAALLAVPTGVFAAFVESLPWRINDNLSVPLLSALFLRGLLEVDGSVLSASALDLRGAFLAGVLVNLVLAAVARRAGSVDRSGMVAGFLVGLLTYTFSSWPGYIVLIAFFALGSVATRLGYARKLRAGIAQTKRGARSAKHALANCGVGVYLAILIAGSVRPEVFVLAYVCAYAAAAFDTVSSEIGQAYGGRPVLITTLRRVPAGTDGAISWLGTVAGGIAALLIGLVAAAAGLLPAGSMWIVIAAGFVGSTADSILGATLEARGLMDNEAVNFSNTLIGALAALAIAALSEAPI